MRHRLPVSDDPPADRGGRHALDPAVESLSHPLSLDSATLRSYRGPPRPRRCGSWQSTRRRRDHEADGPAIRVDAATTRLREVAARTGLVPPTTRLPQVRPAAIPGPRTAPPADLALYRTPLPRRCARSSTSWRPPPRGTPTPPRSTTAAPLTYRDAAGPRSGGWPRVCSSAGVGAGDRVGRPDAVRHRGPLPRDPRRARRRRGLRAGRRRRPRRARRDDLARRPTSAGVLGDGLTIRRPRGARPPRAVRRRRRPDDDAWIIFTSGSTGQAQGRGDQPPLARRRSSTPRPACSSATAPLGPATGCWPACRWPSTPPARRCGWPGVTAPAWSPPRGRWCGRARAGPVAGRARRSRWSRRCRRWPRSGRPRRSTGSGC